jgi:hypothetical protein
VSPGLQSDGLGWLETLGSNACQQVYTVERWLRMWAIKFVGISHELAPKTYLSGSRYLDDASRSKFQAVIYV